MKILKIVGITLAGLAGLFLVSAFTMALWPKANPFDDTLLTAEKYRAHEESIGIEFAQNYSAREEVFEMTDGIKLVGRRHGNAASSAVFILVHGIASAGERWNNPAGLLAEHTGEQVVTFDLRGHGASEGHRHSVTYIGQYEDDVADIVKLIRKREPAKRIFLAGHSMGGGVLLRYALKPQHPDVAGYLLFAPNFGPGPTQRESFNSEEVVIFDKVRTLGLVMLNLVGIHSFDHLPVMYFNAPPEMPVYSFSAAASAQPNPPQSAATALQAIKTPLLLIAGSEDEAFIAQNYEQVVVANGDGQVQIVSAHSHNSILNDPAVYSIVSEWYSSLK